MKPRILVFTVYNKDSHVGCSYSELAKITMPSYEEYCKIHGYDFKIKNQNVLPGRLIGWSRFEFFLENIDNYDYMFYVETDSMLMNQTIRLENLIDDNYEIIVSRTSRQDLIELNTGPTLIKCSDWAKKIFTSFYNNVEYKNHPMVDQEMFNNKINTDSDFRKKCKIVPLRFFNSFCHKWHQEDNFQIGDFICHAAGSSNDYRVGLFHYLNQFIIKMPQAVNYNPFLNIGDKPI
jgi:hypothetical protein